MWYTWRWFGPSNRVSIEDIRQACAKGIVSALHHLAPGVVWSKNEIHKHKQEIALLPNRQSSGLIWNVVKSLPVSEDIKLIGETVADICFNNAHTVQSDQVRLFDSSTPIREDFI